MNMRLHSPRRVLQKHKRSYNFKLWNVAVGAMLVAYQATAHSEMVVMPAQFSTKHFNLAEAATSPSE